MFYSLGMGLLRLILRIASRLEVHGSENIPSNDISYIGVANHIGRLDPIYSFAMLHRNDIIMMVAEKYQKNIITRLMVRFVNGIFVDRYNADLQAMREVLRRIKQGGVLVIAPESTRSPTCSLLKGWDGASYIAAKSGLPILPVGVTGTGDKEVVDRFKRLRRLHVVARVGPTFTLPPLDKANRDAQLATFTEEIMCRIAAELPESYRGFYADHPRLAEILAERSAKQDHSPQSVG
jgi:1-acyl-sn-glycerol-3-phosphate acyltransferase